MASSYKSPPTSLSICSLHEGKQIDYALLKACIENPPECLQVALVDGRAPLSSLDLSCALYVVISSGKLADERVGLLLRAGADVCLPLCKSCPTPATCLALCNAMWGKGSDQALLLTTYRKNFKLSTLCTQKIRTLVSGSDLNSLPLPKTIVSRIKHLEF